MKSIKGRFLRKLKSIPTPTWMPGLVFQTYSPTQGKNRIIVESFSMSEAPLDVKEENNVLGPNADDQEKFVPPVRSKEEIVHASESKVDEISAVSLHAQGEVLSDFDPCLKIECTPPCLSSSVEKESPSDSIQPSALKLGAVENHTNCEPVEHKDKLPLVSKFEDICPPGGRDSIVLYTTSLRGIRKTFEDCNTIRFLLGSFRVVYSERDVSMHLEYREELWEILGGRVVPPRLFIRGRYIGGADEVVGLHEKGMLQSLLEGLPLSPSNNPCRGCAGVRFLLCSTCNGSRKVMHEEEEDGASTRCPDCNENGLIKCSVCG